MMEIIVYFLVSHIPLIIAGFLDYFFKERYKINKKKELGDKFNWNKDIPWILHHPQWPIIIHSIGILSTVSLIFVFGIPWFIPVLTYVLCFLNEDYWYYIFTILIHNKDFPETLPWLKPYMIVKSIRDKDVPWNDLMKYLKTVNYLNLFLIILISLL